MQRIARTRAGIGKCPPALATGVDVDKYRLCEIAAAALQHIDREPAFLLHEREPQ